MEGVEVSTEMLQQAIEWRDRLTQLVGHAKYPEHVQKHVNILDYLIDCAEEIESNLPTRAEVS